MQVEEYSYVLYVTIFFSCVDMGMVFDGRVSDRRLRTVCYLDKIIKETKRERTK